jgi:hypothetical protein
LTHLQVSIKMFLSLQELLQDCPFLGHVFKLFLRSIVAV